jgi:hypothetical protein
MAVLDRFRSPEKIIARETAEIRRQLNAETANVDLIRESLAKLESSMNEDGWRELATRVRQELTRNGLDNMSELSRAMYIANPLIQRAVNVRAYYTWAQGITVKAADDNVQKTVIDPLHEDPLNRAQMFGHQAQLLTDVDQTVDGNTFTALFTNMRGDVAVRTIPLQQIRQIICSEEDYAQVMFYRRAWTTEQLNEQTGTVEYRETVAYYPDINFQPLQRPPKINGIPVRWDSPIIHLRTGGLKHMSFGVPETYAALDWARAYKKFLEDWHSIVASLARFAWDKTTKGSKIQRAKDKLQRLVGEEAVEEAADERQAAGAVHIGSESDTLKPIQKSGATTSAEDAKPSRMMVASAMDLPDTILSGDPQQGNLATAKTLDRPTELAIVSRQEMWKDYRKSIYDYAIRARMTRGFGALRISADVDTTVDVSFPEILEHDVGETVKAIVSAATLDGKTTAHTVPNEALSRKLMEELGYENVDELIKDLEQEIADAEKQDAEKQAQQAELMKAKAGVEQLQQMAESMGLLA